MDDSITVQRTGAKTGSGTSDAEVQILRRSVNHTEEIAAINAAIATARERVIAAEQVRNDEALLASEARKLGESSLENAEQAARIVVLQEKLKLTALDEEAELERQRAAVHAKAVVAENARASAKAEEVLFLEQEKESRRLVFKHETAAENAAKLAEAYNVVIAENEVRRVHLQEDFETQVIGELPVDEPAAMQIRVQVEPRPVPEVPRVLVPEMALPTAKLARVTEHIPAHAPAEVPVEHFSIVQREEVSEVVVNKAEAVASDVPVQAVSTQIEIPNVPKNV